MVLKWAVRMITTRHGTTLSGIACDMTQSSRQARSGVQHLVDIDDRKESY